MRAHQTYTLASILSATQIQPHLYQQILHQIKSPLEQLSLDITQDNSFEAQPPRRPNIPPAPPKSPLGALAEVNFSRTHESASVSLGRTPVKETFADEVLESVLSPLDQQISAKEEPSGPALFCGGLMESILKGENSFEIQLPPTKATRRSRRPIFEGSKLLPRQKSIAEVAAILAEMGEERLALFMRLLGELQVEMGRVRETRQQLKKHMEVIYEKYGDSIEFLREREDSLPTHRLLRRLNSNNTCQLLTRLLSQKNPAKAAEADVKLQALLNSLARLQASIAHFMTRENAVEVLETVHASLEDHYPSERTLLAQIGRLCESFGSQPNLEGFQLVWKEGDRRRVSRAEFVEGVSMNDCIVRLPKSFEEELEMKGFRRNQ